VEPAADAADSPMPGHTGRAPEAPTLGQQGTHATGRPRPHFSMSEAGGADVPMRARSDRFESAPQKSPVATPSPRKELAPATSVDDGPTTAPPVRGHTGAGRLPRPLPGTREWPLRAQANIEEVETEYYSESHFGSEAPAYYARGVDGSSGPTPGSTPLLTATGSSTTTRGIGSQPPRDREPFGDSAGPTNRAVTGPKVIPGEDSQPDGGQPRDRPTTARRGRLRRRVIRTTRSSRLSGWRVMRRRQCPSWPRDRYRAPLPVRGANRILL
jgi:hypothetical protein